jgi:hypothetical protein
LRYGNCLAPNISLQDQTTEFFALHRSQWGGKSRGATERRNTFTKENFAESVNKFLAFN